MLLPEAPTPRKEGCGGIDWPHGGGGHLLHQGQRLGKRRLSPFTIVTTGSGDRPGCMGQSPKAT